VAENVAKRLGQELGDMRVAERLFPGWVSRGLPDYSCTIHSAGISFWSSLGQAMGYEAFSEMPAPQQGCYAFVGDDVRSDSVWFHKETGQPVLLVEFERYSGPIDEEKLRAKADSLLLAHHRWGEKAECAVLAYWTRGLRDLPDHDLLAQRFRRGYRTAAMQPIAGSAVGVLLVYQFILNDAGEARWRLSQIKQRGGK